MKHGLICQPHLIKFEDWLVCHVAPGEVVFEHGDLLIGRGLPPFQMKGHPFRVLLENIVVQESPEGGGRPRTSGLDEQTSDVFRHEVVVEENVLVVLNVELDGRDASAEVPVQADAVVSHLVALHGDDWVEFTSRCVVDCAPLVLLKYTERHVVFHVPVKASRLGTNSFLT